MVVAAQLVDQLQPQRQVQHRQLPPEDRGDPLPRWSPARGPSTGPGSFTAESLSSQYPSGPTRPWRVSGARMLSSPPAHLGHGEHGSVRAIIPCVVDRRLRLGG